MYNSGDAAEQVVRVSLEGAEAAVKITGEGAKQIAVMLYAILRDQRKTKGKIRLTNLLRSGKELKVFAVRDGDLRLFCREAKKYGVLYCVLKDRDAADGITDIMVRAEDAPKINRIFERFGLSTVDRSPPKNPADRAFLDALQAARPEDSPVVNPTQARARGANRSEPTSGRSGDLEGFTSGRPSIRNTLRDSRSHKLERERGYRHEAR